MIQPFSPLNPFWNYIWSGQKIPFQFQSRCCCIWRVILSSSTLSTPFIPEQIPVSRNKFFLSLFLSQSLSLSLSIPFLEPSQAEVAELHNENKSHWILSWWWKRKENESVNREGGKRGGERTLSEWDAAAFVREVLLVAWMWRGEELLQGKSERKRLKEQKNYVFHSTVFFIQRTSLTTCVTCNYFQTTIYYYYFPLFCISSLPLRLLSLYYFLLDLTESIRVREMKRNEKMDKRKRVCYKKYRCDSLAKNESETEGKIHESWHGSWCCFFLMVVYMLVASLILPFFFPTLSLSLSLLLSSSSLPFLPLRSRFVSKSYYFCCYCHSWRIIRNIALLTRVVPSQELDRRVRRVRRARGSKVTRHQTQMPFHPFFVLSLSYNSVLSPSSFTVFTHTARISPSLSHSMPSKFDSWIVSNLDDQ